MQACRKDTVLRSYWVLMFMDQFTRWLVGFGVHCGAATGPDVCRMFNAAIPADLNSRRTRARSPDQLANELLGPLLEIGKQAEASDRRWQEARCVTEAVKHISWASRKKTWIV